MTVKRWIVMGLEKGRELIDRLSFGLGWRTRIGCPNGRLALWSEALDDRWGTRQWTTPPKIDPTPPAEEQA